MPTPAFQTQRTQGNLEHAQWRVKFRQSLLEVHLASSQTSAEWFRKVGELERDVAEAEAELSALDSGYQHHHAPSMLVAGPVRGGGSHSPGANGSSALDNAQGA